MAVPPFFEQVCVRVIDDVTGLVFSSRLRSIKPFFNAETGNSLLNCPIVVISAMAVIAVIAVIG